MKSYNVLLSAFLALTFIIPTDGFANICSQTASGKRMPKTSVKIDLLHLSSVIGMDHLERTLGVSLSPDVQNFVRGANTVDDAVRIGYLAPLTREPGVTAFVQKVISVFLSVNPFELVEVKGVVTREYLRQARESAIARIVTPRPKGD